jgi:ABC-2 type transport system permease protein
MNPIWIVAQREFLTRVRKRTFLVMTLLGPLFFGLLMVAPALLASLPEGPKKILVVDHSYLLVGEKGVSDAEYEFLKPSPEALKSGKESLETNSSYDGLLYLPPSENNDPDYILKNAKLFTLEELPISLVGAMEDQLEQKAYEQKLRLEGVDPEVVKRAETNARLSSVLIGEEGEEENSAREFKMILGLFAGYLIYMFVFLYATQIMRGVIEEKTSRIVEVIISSVKPMQLMLGKIIGIAGVGFLQFVIWVGLTAALYVGLSATLLADALNPETLAQMQAQPEAGGMAAEAISALQSINYPLVLTSFLFYFIGGYLLYGALFAAVGSAVDAESDTQQFMLPLTLPLILALLVSMRIMESPDSPLAFWFSIIPFTSPVVMMVRIPFGVPMWELGLSMVLLVVGFLGTTWLASRIYRIGILSYGKKASFKDLWKWLRTAE